jgi:hypothetical protein
MHYVHSSTRCQHFFNIIQHLVDVVYLPAWFPMPVCLGLLTLSVSWQAPRPVPRCSRSPSCSWTSARRQSRAWRTPCSSLRRPKPWTATGPRAKPKWQHPSCSRYRWATDCGQVCSENPFGRPGRSRGKATTGWGKRSTNRACAVSAIKVAFIEGARQKSLFRQYPTCQKSRFVCRHSQPEAGPGSPWQVSLPQAWCVTPTLLCRPCPACSCCT